MLRLLEWFRTHSNAYSLGPLYATSFEPPAGEQARLRIVWTREAEPPYRRGRGLAVPLGRSRAVVYGLWGRRPGETLDEALRRFLGAHKHNAAPYEIGDWGLDEEDPLLVAEAG